MLSKIIRPTVLILILAGYGLFLAQKIDLTTADIGRHIKNGELILRGDFSVLSRNVYSYTYPDAPVVNHHWGSGVLFYEVHRFFGFEGLSVCYILLSFFAFFLMFRLAEKMGGFWPAALFSLLFLPLIAARKEVRPEVFSTFFSAVFFYLLWEHREGRASSKKLLWLPLLMVVWVNTHIYFFLGLLLIAAFFFEPSANKKSLGRLFLFCAIASCVSPFGIQGILYPLQIFQNYGYRLVENQSVHFLENMKFVRPNFIFFKVALAVSAVLFLGNALKERKKFSIALFLLGGGVTAMACMAIRNFTMYGLLLLPISAFLFYTLVQNRVHLEVVLRRVLVVVVGLALLGGIWLTHSGIFKAMAPNLGLGLAEKNQDSARFFKELSLKGPIFNNYDLGGYLIFNLYPEERVFVDNRPEAYPSAFFKEVYVPAQEDESRWREADEKYRFNVIYFGYHDYTPWAQKFLIERVSDPGWAPVFADGYAVIFLKRNVENQDLISRYELPKSAFRVISNS